MCDTWKQYQRRETLNTTLPWRSSLFLTRQLDTRKPQREKREARNDKQPWEKEKRPGRLTRREQETNLQLRCKGYEEKFALGKKEEDSKEIQRFACAKKGRARKDSERKEEGKKKKEERKERKREKWNPTPQNFLSLLFC